MSKAGPLEEVSANNVRAYIEKIVRDIPHRAAGSENGGVIGATFVAKAPPDGYTLGVFPAVLAGAISYGTPVPAREIIF